MVDAFIQSLHSALGRSEGVIAVSTPAKTPTGAAATAHADERAVARSLSNALDRAIELGQWESAERIAQQAMRIARQHPLLTERIARLRCAQREFEAALSIIEACPQPTSSMRLLRAACLMQTGRGHEAHAHLLHWARRSSAPLQARLMLSLLEWDVGDADAAAATLQQTLRQIEDPSALAALMLMAKAQGRQHMASLWARRLTHACAAHAQRPLFEAMLAASGHRQQPVRMTSTPRSVAALATELIAHEHVIPALVEAQRLDFEPEHARLLADALGEAQSELEQPTIACEALATLHELLGESDIASVWQRRGEELRQPDDVIASIDAGGVRMGAQRAAVRSAAA